MCTLVILRQPGENWPLLIAGNRDELPDRPWLPPARHWDDRPEVVAGLDQLAEGSWMGLNDHGVVSVAMNRWGTLGPEPDKRSRGELVLEALDHAEAEAAVAALGELDPAAYRPFNLFVGDPQNAFVIRNDGARMSAYPVPEGVHMLTALELDDDNDPRIRLHLPRFRAAEPPDPDRQTWSSWPELLASGDSIDPEQRAGAMSFRLESGLTTLSSSLLALPRYPGHGAQPQWLFAAGAPGATPFEPVRLKSPYESSPGG
jgi:hypothetical protein